ncbi:MAG: hypothetical protein AAF546_14225 [Verrucomicrobiota bacterium]
MLNTLSKRPSKTILVDTGSLCFRIDLIQKSNRFDVARVILDEQSAHRNSRESSIDDLYDDALGEDDGAWVTRLLKSKPKPAREVKLLSTRVTSAVLDIPFLGDESKEEAIAIELETFTGLSIDGSQWSWKPLPSEEGILRAWVSQASLTQLMIWRNAVSAVSGCHLAAIFHPAGIPMDAPAQLEIWPGLVIYEESTSERRDIRGWTADETSAFSDDAVNEAFKRDEMLIVLSEGQTPTKFQKGTILRLDEKEGRLRWAQQLAQGLDLLSRRLEKIPRLGIPKPELSNKELAWRTTGIAALVAILLGGHFFFLKSSEERLTEKVATMRESFDEIADARKQKTELTRQIKRLRIGENEEDSFDLIAHKERMAALLPAIGDASNDSIAIQKLESQGMSILISGVSSTSRAPAEYVQLLNKSFTTSGWWAKLSKREASFVNGDGGPWTFTVSLSPMTESSDLAAMNERGQF